MKMINARQIMYEVEQYFSLPKGIMLRMSPGLRKGIAKTARTMFINLCKSHTHYSVSDIAEALNVTYQLVYTNVRILENDVKLRALYDEIESYIISKYNRSCNENN